MGFCQVSASVSLAQHEYKLLVRNLYEEGDVLEQLNNIIYSNCAGLIILGTEMQKPDFMYLKNLTVPIVLLDTYCDFPNVDCVMINIDGFSTCSLEIWET